jgi:hypothetical protein
MKYCKKCAQNKPKTNFSKRTSSKDGLDTYCKPCKKAITDTWISHNKEKLKLIKRKSDANWYSKNKSKKININKKWKQKNADKNREWYREYKKKREKIDPQFKLCNKLRTRLWYALKKQKPKIGLLKLMGCSSLELKTYIESKFQPGMTWDNYGEWEIDHILPLSRFDLTDENQVLKACHYTNLQPLWWQKKI